MINVFDVTPAEKEGYMRPTGHVFTVFVFYNFRLTAVSNTKEFFPQKFSPDKTVSCIYISKKF